MYKINTQSDKESNGNKTSFSSSFWSDTEDGEEEEGKEEEININSKPIKNPEASDEPELHIHGTFTGEVLDRESGDDDGDDDDDDGDDDGDNGGDDDDDDDDDSRSSCGSPAPSLRTSGYGTYRAEEQEEDNTIVQFETNSRGCLSGIKDDKEDLWSLISSELDKKATHDPDLRDSPACLLEDNKLPADGPCSGKDCTLKEDGEEVIRSESKHHLHIVDGQKQLLLERYLEDGLDLTERETEELSDVEAEDKVETKDPDESLADTDIKFIDSKEEVGWLEYKKLCEQWEGHLRHERGMDIQEDHGPCSYAVSLLEEQTAELDLSTSAQKDVEGEGEAGSCGSPSQSSEVDDFSLSTVEPYIRVMTRSQSDGDVRPKPKSFIRPVMSQQNIKKTDPVAKYHQYKKIWGTFKLPGERDRNALHMEIKEKLAYQPPPPKPRRVYEPNTYIVPTEKKRLALRWEIRNYLANGLLPPRFNDQI